MMKLTFILILATSLTVCAEGISQITLKENNTPLHKVFKKIQKQSGLDFLYNYDLLQQQGTVNINVNNVSLEKALEICLKGKPLTYVIVNNTVVIQPQTNDNVSVSAENLLPPPPPSIEVRGVVKDESGKPLQGASISIKGKKTGTVTNEKGEFVLNAEDNSAQLIISFVGMETQIVSIKGKTEFTIVLKVSEIQQQEVVIVGYTYQKKGLLTGSVSTQKVTDALRDMPVTSASEIFTGKIAGLKVSTGSGIPGSMPGISIRTNSSPNSQPVIYVVDGAVQSAGYFNQLSPNEIESITVLKDAASAAIYGSRSDGGVILVTTRKGSSGKTVFNYSYSYSVDERIKGAPVTSAYQNALLYNREWANSNALGDGIASTANEGVWTDAEIAHIKTINGGWGYDGLSVMYKNPVRQTHNLSASGGSEKVKYFISAAYINQTGIVKSLDYSKINLRTNLTAELTKSITLNTNISLQYDKQNLIHGMYSIDDMFKRMLALQPWKPFVSDNGKLLDQGWLTNLPGLVNGDYGYNNDANLNPNINASLTWKIPKVRGLSLKGLVNSRWIQTVSTRYDQLGTVYVIPNNGHIWYTDDSKITTTKQVGTNSPAPVNMTKGVTFGNNYQINLQANYERTFGSHHVTGALVYEKYENSSGNVSASLNNFPLGIQRDQWWAVGHTTSDVNLTSIGGNADVLSGRKSYVGQFTYDYSSKYLFSLSFREDGSMNFAPEKRWGFFPAASAGWVISEEPFLKKNKIITNLKLRMSAGITGNDAIGGWQWQENFVTGSSFYIGDPFARQPGLTYGNALINTNLTWEKSRSYNVATDFELIKHLKGSLEFWHKHTYDILGTRQASKPNTFSRTLPAENYGVIDAWGMDFSLGWSDKIGSLNYYADLVGSWGDNIWRTWDYPQNASPIDIPVGKHLSYVRGYDFLQMIRTQADLDAFNAAYPGYLNRAGGKVRSAYLGTLVFKEHGSQNADGSYNSASDGIINSYDRIILYNKITPVVIGFNLGASWKGISIDMTFNGKLNNPQSFADVMGNWGNLGMSFLRQWQGLATDSWSPETPNAKFPIPLYMQNGADNRDWIINSKFWYEDASFLRLKNLSLGYSIPNKYYHKAVESVKLYVNGVNLFCLSRFKYYDPEGTPYGYPLMKTFSFGLSVKF